MAKPIEFLNWGLIGYQEAFQKQSQFVDKIISGETSEKVIFCTHPPVVTLGRGTKPGDVFAWKGQKVEVNRGGRATYHGPSQVVMYPLIYIGDPNAQYVDKKLKPKDLHQYMRVLEESVVMLLKDLGVSSEGRTLQTQVGESVPEEATGVWVNGKKIASIGIAVRKWVTSHGVALNVHHDTEAFTGMNPCGFRTNQMTDLQTILGEKLGFDKIQQLWTLNLLNLLVK